MAIRNPADTLRGAGSPFGVTTEGLNRDLLDLAHDAIIVRSLDDRILFWNRGASSVYGYSAEEVSGKSCHHLLGTRFPEGRADIIRKLEELGHWEGDLVHRAKGGDDRIVSSRWALHRDEEGKPALILEINRDITSRRHTEEALRAANTRLEAEIAVRTAELQESEQRFRSLIEHSSEIISILSPTGERLYTSPSVERALGYSPTEMLSHQPPDIVHPADVAIVEKAFRAAGGAGVPVHAEFRVRDKAGQWRIFSASFLDLLDEPGVGGIVVNARDMTDLREGEERLRQAMKMEAVGRLAGGIAHDFNNILSIITGIAQLLLLDLPEESPIRGEIAEIDRAATRAAQLTRQLLAFSRRQVLQPRELDLNSVVASLETMLHRTLGVDVAVETNLDERCGPVLADPAQIEQIVMNLVVNARDAMPTGGRLRISTRKVELTRLLPGDDGEFLKPGPYAVLSVSDTGLGMPPEVRRRIFEPFFTTKNPGEGTGLGLSTVYGIVKQSGGGIHVTTDAGRGTTFDIFFPALDRPAGSRPAESNASPRQEIQSGDIGREALAPGRGDTRGNPHRTGRLLVVDDDPAVRKTVERFLERIGHEVESAASVTEALERLQKHSWDLVLTDLQMPGGSGLDLLDRIRQDWPDVRTILMSGRAEAQDAAAAIEKGISRLFLKPFEFSDLKVAVEKALAERSAHLRAVLNQEQLEAALEERVRESRRWMLRSAHALAAAVEAKDAYTAGHADRVTAYAAVLARGVGGIDEESLRLAGGLHDVGKIGVPDAILNEPEALTRDEFDLVRQHPVAGQRILEPLIDDPFVLGVVRSHHERWDGRGYPDNLRGEDIPLAARILAIADTVDAMTSARAYRAGLAWDVAVAEVQSCAESQFDPTLVGLFAEVLPEMERLYRGFADGP